jgi:hypothetical protein
MRIVSDDRKTVAFARTVTLLVLGLTIAGCSSTSSWLGSTSDWFGSSSGKKVSSSGASTDASASASADEPDLDNVTCPDVTVRAGASTLSIAGKSATDPTALDLRYQGSIVRTARECRVNDKIMTIKVGIEGRVVVGPAGGPGDVDVPLRLAVVQEGPQPKTVLSKFIRIPVTIADSGYANFTHIDPEISFPLPQPIANLDSYIVYVGFDPNAAPEKKPAAKPRARSKKVSSSNR